MRWLSVVAGGAAGSLARWAVGLGLAGSGGTFPLATLVVNTTGAFGLGVAGVILTERLAPTRYWRSLVGIGFFGAYTTFSTMAVEGIRLVEGGRLGMALTYWVSTLILGQMAGVYGTLIGRVRRGPREEAT